MIMGFIKTILKKFRNNANLKYATDDSYFSPYIRTITSAANTKHTHNRGYIK